MYNTYRIHILYIYEFQFTIYVNNTIFFLFSAALLVKGAVTVDAYFAIARGEYLYYVNSAVDFNTDLEFADTPYKMCLQMEHPNVVVR